MGNTIFIITVLKGAAMAYIIGCLMAGLSFSLNRLLLKYIGLKIVISYSPIIEELTKTICSYYLEADILATHITFGILEAAYDWYQNNNVPRGKKAAFLSITGHTLFGVLTITFLNLSGSIFIGIFTAICAHLIWNITLIRLAD